MRTPVNHEGRSGLVFGSLASPPNFQAHSGQVTPTPSPPSLAPSTVGRRPPRIAPTTATSSIRGPSASIAIDPGHRRKRAATMPFRPALLALLIGLLASLCSAQYSGSPPSVITYTAGSSQAFYTPTSVAEQALKTAHGV